MKISTKGRYALRLMIDLALQDPDKYIPLREISKRQEISIKYLEQIAFLLLKNGYITSLRGLQGGYKLQKKPELYLVGDILRVIEGEIVPVTCLKTQSYPCGRSDTCKTLPFWKGLHAAVNDYLNSFTLADLAFENKISTDTER
ncbi:MAG: Rrf2 family transcriptional regulator [Candidatus Treponema excrementipullorum]|uniref:Rrf2 family transcriptional regulator n=1 Tax=Candidatus Treponema excrementipullorum TaxID=2838768 RepID=A0A9E2L3Z8_9SPIR|nr:Rrf2 family transcriptional regulator [Candidatus Treponema excrementipullorum]